MPIRKLSPSVESKLGMPVGVTFEGGQVLVLDRIGACRYANQEIFNLTLEYIANPEATRERLFGKAKATSKAKSKRKRKGAR